MRELGLSRPDGEMLVAEAEIEIRRPERVLIRGQSGSGKSTIMRAVAGVWPWGRGSIHLPKGAITFMPQKPYFPVGTLRDAMLYPKVPEGITDEVLKDMLHKVGLDHLRDRLDETERWDHILSGGEQQRVAFARVLVHKPEWIFMDEATSALDETGQENVMELLIDELPETSIVSIGHRPGLEVFHTRELTLVPGEKGRPAEARGRGPPARPERGLPRDVGRQPQAPARARLLVELPHQPSIQSAWTVGRDAPPHLCCPCGRLGNTANGRRPGALAVETNPHSLRLQRRHDHRPAGAAPGGAAGRAPAAARRRREPSGRRRHHRRQSGRPCAGRWPYAHAGLGWRSPWRRACSAA